MRELLTQLMNPGGPALGGANWRRGTEAGSAESGVLGPGLGLRLPLPLPAHRYVQSLLDIMEFLDKDPEDHRTLSQ